MGETHVIDSLLEYVKFLESECQEADILFRGQRREDHVLLPRIARLRLKKHVLGTEREMLHDFKRQAIPYLQISPENDWEWLAAAQHHGMATRLLDWTWNPLAALWFSVAGPARDGTNGVVWAFAAGDDEKVYADVQESPLEQSQTYI
ncbi:MAG: FRG domain-containing protein [Phycisphaerales bacterium]|nr:MAG: FRG domain-containing protein [Phycisphaerales bacterium]